MLKCIALIYYTILRSECGTCESFPMFSKGFIIVEIIYHTLHRLLTVVFREILSRDSREFRTHVCPWRLQNKQCSSLTEGYFFCRIREKTLAYAQHIKFPLGEKSEFHVTFAYVQASTWQFFSPDKTFSHISVYSQWIPFDVGFMRMPLTFDVKWFEFSFIVFALSMSLSFK